MVWAYTPKRIKKIKLVGARTRSNPRKWHVVIKKVIGPIQLNVMQSVENHKNKQQPVTAHRVLRLVKLIVNILVNGQKLVDVVF